MSARHAIRAFGTNGCVAKLGSRSRGPGLLYHMLDRSSCTSNLALPGVTPTNKRGSQSAETEPSNLRILGYQKRETSRGRDCNMGLSVRCCRMPVVPHPVPREVNWGNQRASWLFDAAAKGVDKENLVDAKMVG